MIKGRIILLCICTMIALPSFAQKEEDGGIVSANEYTRHFTFGAGALRQSFRDESLSKIMYTGYGFAPSLGHIKQNGLTYSELYLQASSLTASRKDTTHLFENKIAVKRAFMDYKFLIRMKMQNENYDLRIGASATAFFCYKNAPQFANSGKVHEYGVTLGPSAMFTRRVDKWERTCELSWALSAPLLAYYARPAFLNHVQRLDPADDNPSKDYFGTTTTAFAGKYIGIKSHVSFIYPLTNGNAINFGYRWDYYKLQNENNKAYLAEHTVSLIYMFNY